MMIGAFSAQYSRVVLAVLLVDLALGSNPHFMANAFPLSFIRNYKFTTLVKITSYVLLPGFFLYFISFFTLMREGKERLA